ncbi:UNVERIFIED_CONTAM: hypothetical protein Sradi_7102000 [Sesamum radiatum]|uniref:Uncharacterized protein n=1 Tax=Sesamum radiatum TaxID=300843 RepID=A0AAW2J1A4_SESRA
MSGLHVNPNKSTIILSKSVRSERQAILDYTGFQEAALPIKYLGVPLIASRLTVANCQPLIEKFNSRLAGWGHILLSFAGRLQLLKSVLSSLHMYWSSVFILPKAVIKVIKRRMRDFLWKGVSGSEQAKVSWVQVCKHKEEGGLGIPRVGDGGQFSLWGDIWHPQGPLLFSFPRGPRITGRPADSLLQTVIHQGRWRWPSSTDFDIHEILSNLPAIYQNQPDEIKWKLNRGLCSSSALLALLQPISSRVHWHLLLSGKFKSHAMGLFFGWLFWSAYPPWIEFGCPRLVLAVFFVEEWLWKVICICSLSVRSLGAV